MKYAHRNIHVTRLSGPGRGLHFETPTAAEEVAPEPQVEAEVTPDPQEAEPQAETPTNLVFNGKTISLNKDELTQLASLGLQTMYDQQNQTNVEPEPQQPAEPQEVTVDSVNDKIDKLTEQFSKFIKTSETKEQANSIARDIDTVIAQNDLVSNNKDLSNLVKKAALAEIQSNPALNPVQAVESGLGILGKLVETTKEDYLNKKRKNGTLRSVPEGEAPGIAPQKFSGGDMKSGKLRAHARNRLANIFED